MATIDVEDGDAGLVDVAIGRRLLSDVIKLDRETNINLVPFVTPSSRRDRQGAIRPSLDGGRRAGSSATV